MKDNSTSKGSRIQDIDMLLTHFDCDDIIILITKALFCLTKYQVNAVVDVSFTRLLQLDRNLALETLKSLMRARELRSADKPKTRSRACG